MNKLMISGSMNILCMCIHTSTWHMCTLIHDNTHMLLCFSVPNCFLQRKQLYILNGFYEFLNICKIFFSCKENVAPLQVPAAASPPMSTADRVLSSQQQQTTAPSQAVSAHHWLGEGLGSLPSSPSSLPLGGAALLDGDSY